MSSPFTDFRIMPSYSRGFVYTWDIAGDFNDSGPWTFTVQEGPTQDGPWKTISPQINNEFMWKEDSRPPVNKSSVLHFRMCLKTPSGKYFSSAIQPYGTLNRRDFLVAREIMRQAVLHSRGMAGVIGHAYIVSTTGPKCQECLDPITGMIRDSHCKHCMGTGRDPAYHGPYEMWLDFSEDDKHQTAVDKTGTVEKKEFMVRAIGNPRLKQGDVIVVPSTDKRYYIGMASMSAEMRTVPILQTLALDEAPLTDKIYDL